MADLTRLADRLNHLLAERDAVAFRLLQGVRTLTGAQVHALKRHYSYVARRIQRLERRLK